MFVNVSPVMWNVSETLCSLRFAKRCASVQLGQAKKSSESVRKVCGRTGTAGAAPLPPARAVYSATHGAPASSDVPR